MESLLIALIESLLRALIEALISTLIETFLRTLIENRIEALTETLIEAFLRALTETPFKSFFLEFEALGFFCQRSQNPLLIREYTLNHRGPHIMAQGIILN